MVREVNVRLLGRGLNLVNSDDRRLKINQLLFVYDNNRQTDRQTGTNKGCLALPGSVEFLNNLCSGSSLALRVRSTGGKRKREEG